MVSKSNFLYSDLYSVGGEIHLALTTDDVFRGVKRMRRVAIIVTHANQEPYISILEGFRRPNLVQIDEFTFDIYYLVGRNSRILEDHIRRAVERIRYTSLWPILRVYDSTLLRIASRNLPEVTLVIDSSGRNFLSIDTPEDQRHIATKVYSAVNFCQSHNYEFLIRTTSNSILNLPRVLDLLRGSKKMDLLYAGREVMSFKRPSFVSGSLLILNRNSMNYLLKERRNHDYGVLDDVAIGKIFNSEVEVSKRIISSVDYQDIKSVLDFPLDAVQSVLHFRCKANSTPRNDLELMSALAEKLQRAGVNYV